MMPDQYYGDGSYYDEPEEYIVEMEEEEYWAWSN
jgi:hypothetical protein